MRETANLKLQRLESRTKRNLGGKGCGIGNGALEGEKSRWRDSDLFEKIETKVFVDRDKQATVIGVGNARERCFSPVVFFSPDLVRNRAKQIKGLFSSGPSLFRIVIVNIPLLLKFQCSLSFSLFLGQKNRST